MKRLLISGLLSCFLGDVYANTTLYGIDALHSIEKKKSGVYVVQVGAFRNAENADRIKHQLKQQYPSYPVVSRYSQSRRTTYVSVGPISIGAAKSLRVNATESSQRVSRSSSQVIVEKDATPEMDKFAHEVSGHRLHWVGSLTGAVVWAKAGETQTFYLTPDIEKTYLAQKDQNTFGMGEVFLGGEKQMRENWLAQLGLALSHSGNADLQGIIWDDADPLFDNYSYHYNVKTTRLSLKGKLLYTNNQWISPWVSATLGAAFNRANGFVNTPLIPEAVANSNFGDSTKTAFSYSLAVGIEKALNDNLRFAIGYEFSDWGKSELDRAYDQTLNSGLSLSHLYTNSLIFNISLIS